jgi:hypothetical protein
MREKINKIIFNSQCILEGWRNSIFKKITIEEVADIRRAICVLNVCKKYKTKPIVHCQDCGCPIEKKIRSLRTSCPVNLWGNINELKLVITPNLFERSDFYVDKVDGVVKHFRHKKFKDVLILFNTENSNYSNGIIIFEFWNQIQDYFREKTGKNLN